MLFSHTTFTHIQNVFSWDGILPPGVRRKGHCTLDALQSILSDPEKGLAATGIPVTFTRDQILFLRPASKHPSDCLVLKHAAHPEDYFHFVFTARFAEGLTTLGFYRSGHSPHPYRPDPKGPKMGGVGLLDPTAAALPKGDAQDLRDEYAYYHMVAARVQDLLL